MNLSKKRLPKNRNKILTRAAKNRPQTKYIMKNQRFRISKNDEIKATACAVDGGLLSSLYDSQFTTIGEVVGVLIRKIPYYSGKKIEVKIWNITSDKVKYLTVNVNK